MTWEPKRRRRPPKGERGEGWWIAKSTGEWWCFCGAGGDAPNPQGNFEHHWIRNHMKGGPDGGDQGGAKAVPQKPDVDAEGMGVGGPDVRRVRPLAGAVDRATQGQAVQPVLPGGDGKECELDGNRAV